MYDTESDCLLMFGLWFRCKGSRERCMHEIEEVQIFQRYVIVKSYSVPLSGIVILRFAIPAILLRFVWNFNDCIDCDVKNTTDAQNLSY
jgi:hypothetical protein